METQGLSYLPLLSGSASGWAVDQPLPVSDGWNVDQTFKDNFKDVLNQLFQQNEESFISSEWLENAQTELSAERIKNGEVLPLFAMTAVAPESANIVVDPLQPDLNRLAAPYVAVVSELEVTVTHEQTGLVTQASGDLETIRPVVKSEDYVHLTKAGEASVYQPSTTISVGTGYTMNRQIEPSAPASISGNHSDSSHLDSSLTVLQKPMVAYVEPAASQPSGIVITSGVLPLTRPVLTGVKTETISGGEQASGVMPAATGSFEMTTSPIKSPSQIPADARISTQTSASFLVETQSPVVPINKLGQTLVQMLYKGERQLEFRLDPPELGKMIMTVAMEREAVSLQIITSTSQARDLLQLHSERLREALSNESLTLSQMEVEADTREHSSGSHSGFQTLMPAATEGDGEESESYQSAQALYQANGGRLLDHFV